MLISPLFLLSILNGCASKNVYLNESDKIYFPIVGSTITYLNEQGTAIVAPIESPLVCLGKGNLMKLQKEAGEKAITDGTKTTSVFDFISKMIELLTPTKQN